ncbi:phage tail tape measure protein [Staphylococcus saprophyticus]|uniref:phage tail tape measure protein n=1 Tax=Staphylococcus saprophyticus TaxID=29385 RepID=UPI00065F6D69|nr:phage tail tape measure protein [Staphylococcus saprophyticus]AMG33616.1 phage tail tape measure protein [Staphylococcus saprophyticus]MDW3837883.1 phage tail tape measure protein [Staphylococcus saprophyticus]MDW4061909.1 phage tail tape measure protein [Staphylococcus saprophyticus]MDW4104024.1 phage tail tape measure protein [Staphylococcus saprophyticus]MDW4205110.1 phage tail tape measure protein [Staphylococcus saprophyticus]
MSENIKGVTIRNTIDNSQVEEGFKGLKRQLGLANSELKSNLSAFEKSEQSMKKYQTRIDGLNNKMKIQKQMFNQAEQELKDLNANYTKAKQTVSGVEKAYKSLADATKKEKAALDKSNDAVKSSNAELKKSQSQYKRTTEQKEKAYQKLKQLRQAEKDLKNSNQATTAQLKRAADATQKQSQKHKELVQKYKDEDAQVKKLRKQNDSLVSTNKKVKDTYDKTNTELKQTEKEYNNLNSTIKNHGQNLTNAQKKVNDERTSMNNLQKSINKTSQEMKSFNKEQLIANSQFTKTANHLDTMSEKFGKIGHGMTSVGRSMSIGVTTPIVAGFGASVKAAVDYEQALAGVAKTTNLSGAELNKMSDEITGMSKQMPFAATEIAGVAEAAGQLGVKKSEITDFTKTMLDMSVATNLTSEEAATEFARFANAAGMPIDKVDRLGASVVALGNTTATTEKEIVEMGQRLAGAGSQAGFSADQIMSISAAMSSVGIEAEAGGTAMTQIFNKMTKATAEGGETLDNFGKTAGMTGKEFAETWEENPTKALSAFVKGLSNTEGGAKGVLKALDSVGIKGIREADTIRRLSNNHTVLDKALRTGAKGWKENNALTNEAKTRYKTMGSQLQIFKNQLFALGKDIGNVIAPVVVGITKKFGQWAESFTKMPKPIKGVAIALGLVAAATGPVVLGVGLLLRAVGSAAKGYASLNRQMAINTAEATVNAGANKAAAGSLVTTGKATKGQQGMFGKLGNVLSTTTGRYGKLGKAVKLTGGILGKLTIPLTIITTIFGVAYQKIDWFKQGFSDMGKIVNQVGKSIDFSWVGKMTKEISGQWEWLKNDMARGLQDGALFKGIKVGFDGLHKAVSKASDTTDVFAGKVSKGTKKALGSYNNLSEKAKTKLEEIRISHSKIGDKQLHQITSLYGNINEEITKQLDKRHDSEVKGLQKIFNRTNGLTKSEEAKILETTKNSNKKESKEAQKINNQILGIYKVAHKEKRSLTKKENAKVAELQRNLDKTVVKSLSKGEVEQKAILERMKQNKGKLSMQAASNVIKESAKERDTTIKDAKKKYKDTVAEAVKQRDETGTLSKSQADKVIKDAKKQYDESKGKAKKQHKAVVDQAQKQNKGVKKNIDSQTGHVKSQWEIMKDSSIGGAKKIAKNVGKWFKETHQSANKFWNKIGKKIGDKSKDGYNGAKKWLGKLPGKTSKWFKDTHQSANKFWNKIGKKIGDKSKDSYNGAKKWLGKTKDKSIAYFKDTKNGADKWWNKLGKKIGDKSKDSYNGAKKWLGKTKDKSISYFKDTKNGADKWWNKIGSKISGKSKDSYNSAKKWFGKMKDSTGDRLSDMWGKAKDIFGKIAGEGEDKSKKTHGSWKGWLGKTLDWIKNIKKDFGKAASDLGKSVANKAIDGLNGMIGGINKISKAITDKTLIKPITPLSTGTYNGASVATDSEGGLKQSTLAVVNDKGSGNAPGGGVQEVIEKADGSLHAPQGRNVVVSLDPGDKVHNATDTKRYQDMGLLPRFHGGTKKKKKDDPLASMIADKFSDVAGGFKEGASKTAHGIKKKTEDGLEKTSEMAKKGAAWLGDKIGDVWDYVSNPKKLVNKVMESMGIDFGKGANATVGMAKGAYSKLKTSLADKVKSMFEEFGGEGDASWLFKHDIWQRFGNYTGGLTFNGGKHYGMDFGMPTGTNVYAVKGGIADKVWTDFGGGNSVQIKTAANEWNWYMHLSKQIARQGQRIKAGQLIGKSGATGNFVRGAHLHFQLMRGGHPGNDTAVNPEKWLHSLEGKGGANSGPKAVQAWRPEVMKALGLAGLPQTAAYANAWLRQINTESTGNPKAVGPGSSEGNPKGLVQVKPGTFNAFKLSGHGNIFNGLDNLIAGMRYAKATYGGRMLKQIGVGGPYANGGMVTKHQIAEIGEGNKAEMVIPLTKRNRAVQLIEQAMQYVGMDTGKTNVTVNNDNSTIEKLLKQLVRVNDQNNKLTQTIISLLSNQKQGNPKDATNIISQILGENMRMASYSQGG